MKALSLTQPWASLVAIGEKQIETRSWSTIYRGTLAIHAAKGFPTDARRLCALQEPFRSVLMKAGFNVTGPNKADFMPLGVIVAVCELTAVHRIPFQNQHFARFDVPTQHHLASYSVTLPPLEWAKGFGNSHEFDFGDYAAGRYAWILTDVRALKEPILCRGALSLWDVPANVEKLMREQLNLLG